MVKETLYFRSSLPLVPAKAGTQDWRYARE
jgi:hypothetical protein